MAIFDEVAKKDNKMIHLTCHIARKTLTSLIF